MNATASFSGRKGGLDTHPAVVSLSVGSYVGGRKMKSHYTYRLAAVNPIDERVEYIGVRSCNGLPADDAAYMSSSREILALIKSGVKFVKEIIAVHETRKKAVAHEIELHAAYDVARSLKYFNKAKQTSDSFDVSGTKLNPEIVQYLSKVHKARLSDPTVRREISRRSKEVAARPGQTEKMSIAMKKVWQRADFKQFHSQRIKEFYSNPENIREWMKTRSTPEYKAQNAIRNADKGRSVQARAKNSEKAKARMADPARRANLSAKVREQMSCPAMRQRLSEAAKIQMSDPKTRQHLSEVAKIQMSSPDMRNRLKEAQKETQETKRRFFELSGFTGNKRNVTLSQAMAWLDANVKKAS
jgi:hypothetical protein